MSHQKSTSHDASSTEQKRLHHLPTWAKWTLGIVGALLILFFASAAGATLYLANRYDHTMIPGTHIGAIDLSGMTYMEALDAVEKQVAKIETSGITLHYEDEEIILPSRIVPLDAAGEEVELFHIHEQATVDAAYTKGRTGSLFKRAGDFWNTWRGNDPVYADATFNTQQIDRFFDAELAAFETMPVNATMEVKDGANIEITPGKPGTAFSRSRIIDSIRTEVTALSGEPITIMLTEVLPPVTSEMIEANTQEITTLLARTPLTFTYQEQSWEFDAKAVGAWLTYTENGVEIDAEELRTSLKNVASDTDIEVEPVEGRWKAITNEEGKLTGLEAIEQPVVGKKIDATRAALEALTALKSTEQPQIALHITEHQPKFQPKEGEELPVRDLLGTGHSNMAGSPANRQKNIRRGVELLHGLLIAPGEEFSLVEALKPFTFENGYLAELVIKGNETIPEIGGGLCQVGTTTFRAAMSSGLDITQRRNHSYAVSYYADDRNGLPGTDATIYDPNPDFRFQNDTPGFILMQTRVDGTHLYFDFWGVSDGRKGAFSEPTISGWVAPPPTKYIETDTLAPGETKCTETAHPGTTARFTYTVEKPDGTKHEEEFVSVYKPWQAVCLRGKAAAPAPEPASKETKKTDSKKKTH